MVVRIARQLDGNEACIVWKRKGEFYCCQLFLFHSEKLCVWLLSPPLFSSPFSAHQLASCSPARTTPRVLCAHRRVRCASGVREWRTSRRPGSHALRLIAQADGDVFGVLVESIATPSARCSRHASSGYSVRRGTAPWSDTMAFTAQRHSMLAVDDLRIGGEGSAVRGYLKAWRDDELGWYGMINLIRRVIWLPRSRPSPRHPWRPGCESRQCRERTTVPSLTHLVQKPDDCVRLLFAVPLLPLRSPAAWRATWVSRAAGPALPSSNISIRERLYICANRAWRDMYQIGRRLS